MNGVDVSTDGLRGSLSLDWRENSKVFLRNNSANYIDVDVQDSDNSLHWCFTGFYGVPYAQGREDSWIY